MRGSKGVENASPTFWTRGLGALIDDFSSFADCLAVTDLALVDYLHRACLRLSISIATS